MFLLFFGNSVDLFAVYLKVGRSGRRGFCMWCRCFLCLWLLFCSISHIDLLYW